MKPYVKIDRKVLFQICDAILEYEGVYVKNSCPENLTPYFVYPWNEKFRRKVENIRKNS